MRTIVVSLGGSLIFKGEIDFNYLKKFKELIKKYSKKFKFVIVLGGGKVARLYINALAKVGLPKKEQCLIGIRVTRLNAWFMANFFKPLATQTIPKSLVDVKHLLAKNNIVFAGALRYKPDNTSDGTAASIARFLKAEFINLTNVNGLYSKDPNKYKDAKFIPEISAKEFYKIASALAYKPGQHFVLDQQAAKIILKYKVKTVIMNGRNLKNFENYLTNKKFTGTVIF